MSKSTSKQTSILSFFNKTPSSTSRNQQPLSNLSSNIQNNETVDTKLAIKKQKFDIYDVIWARLEGYPFWPALVCNHPSGKFFKKQRGVEYLNCQFFDNPPQR